MYQVNVGDKIYQVPENTSFRALYERYNVERRRRPILCRVNGVLKELFNSITEDCTVEYLDATDQNAYEAFRRSCILLFIKAFHDIVPEEKNPQVFIEFSMGNGYFIHVSGQDQLDERFLKQLDSRMMDLVAMDIPFEKTTVETREAINFFHVKHSPAKEKLFRYRRASRTNLYTLDNYVDYFYGYMTPSTSYLENFRLYLYQDGIVMQLPSRWEPDIVPDFIPQDKLYHTLSERMNWCRNQDAGLVSSLNEHIVNGTIGQLIMVQEAMMEQKLGEIAEQIASNHEKKLILIAGPSSSGKTTFSHRLSIQLKAHGLNPHPIEVDNYFMDREKMPRDENGEYNFEDLECIDVELFNDNMLDLLAGKEVALPTFNFKTGKQEFRGNTLKLKDGDVLVMEGIHCLNRNLTYRLPDDPKFKIYLSALTTLNLDEHNRMSTTDGRLLRRMVRDARTRGTSASETFARWESVRRGEFKNIFPYQEEADVMFNSSLVYEMCSLKQAAEPLLYSIKPDDPAYQEATRLLKLLEYVLGIDSSMIPYNSIIREFIGGSCFNV